MQTTEQPASVKLGVLSSGSRVAHDYGTPGMALSSSGPERVTGRGVEQSQARRTTRGEARLHRLSAHGSTSRRYGRVGQPSTASVAANNLDNSRRNLAHARPPRAPHEAVKARTRRQSARQGDHGSRSQRHRRARSAALSTTPRHAPAMTAWLARCGFHGRLRAPWPTSSSPGNTVRRPSPT